MALGFYRALIREPLVVHVLADGGKLELVGRADRAEDEGIERAAGRIEERKALPVLAAVVDDLGGDAVAVHVLETLVDIVVAGVAFRLSAAKLSLRPSEADASSTASSSNIL